MSKEIRASYDEILMFPPAVEDWVEQDHPARFLRAFVQELDLRKLGFQESKAGRGRPHYGADLLLKAWLYGYMNHIRSTRQLEWACREHLSLIWLLGRETPDHNTLWRFWQRNQKAVRALFVEVVRVAVQGGLVGFVLHAVDGTRMEAVASTERAHHRKGLEKWIEKLESYMDEVEEQIRRGEEEEEGSYRLPEELQDEGKLREKIRALRRLNEAGRDHLNESEPEARMTKIGGRKRFGYNAQVVVDESSQLIVAEQVVADETDYGQLIPMLEQTKENVGKLAQDTVADKGYRSDAGMAEAEKRGYSVLVPLYENEGEKAPPYHGSRFHYEERTDSCLCPQGERLRREGGYGDARRQIPVRTYRCTVFERCAVARECSRDPKGRKVKMTEYRAVVARQRQRQALAENREKLSRRKGIVERSFAEIKQHMGLRRWTYRGLRGTNTQWALMCTAYNLRKLFPHWVNGSLQLAAD